MICFNVGLRSWRRIRGLIPPGSPGDSRQKIARLRFGLPSFRIARAKAQATEISAAISLGSFSTLCRWMPLLVTRKRDHRCVIARRRACLGGCQVSCDSAETTCNQIRSHLDKPMWKANARKRFIRRFLVSKFTSTWASHGGKLQILKTRNFKACASGQRFMLFYVAMV